VDRVLERRVSGVAAIRAGATRLWERAAFAVVATWATVTIVAIVVVAPAWAWWTGALGHTIDGARLLGSPNVATLVEMLRASPFAARMSAAAALAGGVLALFFNPFLAGGVIGALVREPRVREPGVDAGGPATRFAADGVRLYGPLLRVALIVWPIAAVAIGVGAAAAAIPLAGTRVPALAVAGAIAVIACGTLAASMLVDLARIHVARTGVRRAGAAVLAALRIVASQPARLLVVALVFGIALALAMVALLAVRGWLSGETWPSILAGIAVQQAHAFARTWLRASLMASEVVLAEADADVRAARAAALAEAAAIGAATEAEAASVAPLEERPEVLVVVQGEAGEGRLAGDERPGGGDLAPEIAGRLPAEGDGRRGDRDPQEAGPALPAVAGDRPHDEPPPVA
jgi:hypothetical protein